jgi:hypothetical protein
MPLDAAAYMRGYRACEKDAHLNIGLPVPVIDWPKNLFGNEISPRDLTAEDAHGSKINAGKDNAGPMASVIAAAAFQAAELSPSSLMSRPWVE